MIVSKAFEFWRVAKKLVKNCERERPCKPCGKVAYTLSELEMGIEIIRHFGYFESEELNLPSMNSGRYKNGKKWMEEVKKRIKMIKTAHSNEELPVEISEIFERLEKRMKAHPPAED